MLLRIVLCTISFKTFFKNIYFLLNILILCANELQLGLCVQSLHVNLHLSELSQDCHSGVAVFCEDGNIPFLLLFNVFAIGNLRRMIVQYIEKFGAATRSEIDVLLMDKLSDVLSEYQKKNKIKNLLYSLNRKNIIKLNGKRQWVMV